MLVTDVLTGAEPGVGVLVGENACILLLLDQERDQVVHEGSDTVASGTNGKIENDMERTQSTGAGEQIIDQLVV